MPADEPIEVDGAPAYFFHFSYMEYVFDDGIFELNLVQ